MDPAVSFTDPIALYHAVKRSWSAETTPDPFDRPKGCQFAPRCPYKVAACEQMPQETHTSPTHRVMCWRYEELAANA